MKLYQSNDEKNEADEGGESEIFSMSPGKNAAENETRERLEILESKVNQIMNRIDFTDRKKEEKSEKENERKKEYERLLSKVRLLERENEYLHD